MYNLRPVLIEATLRMNVRTAYHVVYVTTLQTLWILSWALAGLKLNCFMASSGKSQSEVMTDPNNMKVNMSQLDYHVKSASLLTNAHTFLYGSNASLHCRCKPSTLKNNSALRTMNVVKFWKAIDECIGHAFDKMPISNLIIFIFFNSRNKILIDKFTLSWPQFNVLLISKACKFFRYRISPLARQHLIEAHLLACRIKLLA